MSVPMTILLMLGKVLIGALLGGSCLWLGGKVVREPVGWVPATLISLAVALLDLIPIPSLIMTPIDFIVTLVLLKKLDCIGEVFPGGVLLVIVSGILTKLVLAMYVLMMMNIAS